MKHLCFLQGCTAEALVGLLESYVLAKASELTSLFPVPTPSPGPHCPHSSLVLELSQGLLMQKVFGIIFWG